MITVYGVPYSMKNSRRLIIDVRTHRPRVIKSEQSLKAFDDYVLQLRALGGQQQPYIGPLVLVADLYYPNARFDGDVELVKDCLQAAGVIENDRQFVRVTYEKHISKDSPRVEMTITSYG